ncbi:MAG: hypothetical protein NTW03_23045, partial [Verrucomicrobia bacterium]|nr:hypothetical protein [Verrucomicrobiota bacterium]
WGLKIEDLRGGKSRRSRNGWGPALLAEEMTKAAIDLSVQRRFPEKNRGLQDRTDTDHSFLAHPCNPCNPWLHLGLNVAVVLSLRVEAHAFPCSPWRICG